MPFDVEQFLNDMRDESRAQHKELRSDLSKVSETVQVHTVDLALLKAWRTNSQWLTRALIGAVISICIAGIIKLFS